MLRRLGFASFVLVAIACTPTSPVTDPGFPPVGARVLIDDARGLAIEPRRDAPRVFPSRPDLRAAEVVGRVGEFVELRPVGEPPGRVCSARPFHPDFDVRWYALPDELEPVLGVPLREAFDDGTELELLPGVPIVGEDARLRVGRAELEVPLAKLARARWFDPVVNERPPGHVGSAGYEPLRYGDHRIADAWGRPFNSAYAVEETGDAFLLSFADACGRFTLRSDVVADRLGRNLQRDSYDLDHQYALFEQMPMNLAPNTPAREVGILGMLESGTLCSTTRYVSARSELRWRTTGTRAGVVVRATALPLEVSEVDADVCFEVAGLGLCVAGSAVEVIEHCTK